MVSFRLCLINKIKVASTDVEVVKIVEDSIERLKMKKVNGHLIQRFIESMDRSLCKEKNDQHTIQAAQNMVTAIDFLKSMRKTNS